jgi:hypothetical protein
MRRKHQGEKTKGRNVAIRHSRLHIYRYPHICPRCPAQAPAVRFKAEKWRSRKNRCKYSPMSFRCMRNTENRLAVLDDAVDTILNPLCNPRAGRQRSDHQESAVEKNYTEFSIYLQVLPTDKTGMPAAALFQIETGLNVVSRKR